MTDPRYLLDANCFITPFNTYYPFLYVPAYWKALLREHHAGAVFTLTEVKDEISQKEDDLRDWMEDDNFPASFTVSMNEKSLQKFGEIFKWTQAHPVYSPAEKNKFSTKKTDGFLVAYAHTQDMVLVTQEKHISDPKTKQIKIPNLCEQFGVECINLFEMLKRLNVRFVLGKPPQSS